MEKKYEYMILQCPINTSYCFRGFDEAKETWKREDYVHVYRGFEEAETINDLLEKIFVKFNVNRPDDFYGRSMSMSDVVWVNTGIRGQRIGSYYYCDRFGWSECPTER